MNNARCRGSLRLQDEITAHIHLKCTVRDLQPSILETNVETTGMQTADDRMGPIGRAGAGKVRGSRAQRATYEVSVLNLGLVTPHPFYG